MGVGFWGLYPGSIKQACRLLAAGEPVEIWDTRAELSKDLGDAGAHLAGSLAQFVGNCDVIVLTSARKDGSDGSAMCDDIRELANATGKVVIYQSSDDPSESNALAARLAKNDIALIGVWGADNYADNDLALLAAGDDGAWRRALPTLQKLSAKVIRCGTRAGDARAALIIDRMITAASGLGALEAIAAGRKMGLALSAILQVMNSGSGRNYMTRTILPNLLEGRYSLGLSMSEMLADLNQAMELGMRCAAPSPIATVARGLIQASSNMLSGDAPFTDIHRVIDKLTASNMLEINPGAASSPEGAMTGIIPKLGYVGIGAMGGPLARRLMRSTKVTVYDRRRDLVELLESDGALAANDLGALARNSEIIFLCLPSSDVVKEALFGKDGLAQSLSPGSIIVDQTTGDPHGAKMIAEELRKVAVDFVDAPVSGGPENATAGTTTIICGGAEDAFRKVCPVLSLISPNTIYCGPTGSGHAAKLVNNASNISNRLICYEAAVLAHKWGLSLSVIDEVVNRSSGWSFASQRMFKSIQTHAPTATISLDLSLKDIWSAVQLGTASGVSMAIADMVRTLFQMGVLEFGGDANVDEIARLFESLAKTDFRHPPLADRSR